MSEQIIRKLPEVSLISSWFIADPLSSLDGKTGIGEADESHSVPPGITLALEEGIALLDLYFLSHQDVEMYARHLKQEKKDMSPQAFAARLKATEVREIVRFLRRQLVMRFKGRGVGRRPRFGGVATFFPGISVPKGDDANEASRHEAVRALRNTLYLAHCLGCRVVEAVGGSGVPAPDSNRRAVPNDYTAERIEALAKSLIEVYSVSPALEAIYDGPNPLKGIEDPPLLALELEPGISFLLQDVCVFLRVRREVYRQLRDLPQEDDRKIGDRIRLNADLAHFFLLGYQTPQALDETAVVGEEKPSDLIAHMHISDHAGDSTWGGTHSNDLVPGQFHFRRHFEPWINFAISRSNPPAEDSGSARRPNNRVDSATREDIAPFFSGLIAVELEANNAPDQMYTAVQLVRRWVRWCARHRPPTDEASLRRGLPDTSGVAADTHSGAVMVIDLGNSTSEIFSEDRSHEDGVWILQRIIEVLCRTVREAGGSVMSFTGDGFIATFEEAQLGETTARTALTVARQMPKKLKESLNPVLDALYRQLKKELYRDSKSGLHAGLPWPTIRVSLHRGVFCIPTRGLLRDEVIGRDVVCSARVCAYLSKEIEPKLADEQFSNDDFPKDVHRSAIGLTEAFWEVLPPATKPEWEEIGSPPLPGLGPVTIYLPREHAAIYRRAIAGERDGSQGA